MSLLSDIGTAIKNKLGGTSVDNTVPRYDGTTCKLQGSGVTISDTNAVTASGGFIGNASTATKLNNSATNWYGTGAIDSVVGMLAWKSYRDGHVIFDASNGTAPTGTAVNNTNAQIPWTSLYPTLMGWDGGQTYGVRVDSARVADAFSTVSGSAPSYACRAWVNFNGAGTVAIRASGNVSSITDNGTGNYTVNFTTTMPDANYTVLGTASISGYSGSDSSLILIESLSATNTYALKTTSAINILTSNNNSNELYDSFSANVSIFR